MYNKTSFINETDYAEVSGTCWIMKDLPNYAEGHQLCTKLCARIIQRSLVYGAPYWETKDTSQKNHQSVILSFVFIRYRDSEDNTVGKNYSVFSLICQQGHAGSKTLHRQNAPVLNWRCQLTQVDMAIKRGWLLLSICYCVIGHVVTLTYFAQMRSMME